MNKRNVTMRDLSIELQFTQIYKDHLHDDRAIREAYCLQFLMPRLFDPIQDQDRFAGRIHYLPVGFGLELASGGPGFYCHENEDGDLWNVIEQLSGEERWQAEEMISFWREHATVNGILMASLPLETLQATSNPIAHMGGRLAGALLDFTSWSRWAFQGCVMRLTKVRPKMVTCLCILPCTWRWICSWKSAGIMQQKPGRQPVRCVMSCVNSSCWRWRMHWSGSLHKNRKPSGRQPNWHGCMR
jgi:hypothetical protein